MVAARRGAKAAAPPVEETGPARPTALVGSAQILKATRLQAPKNVPWQTEAWDFWRTMPEPSFAATWLGHGFSRCRLYIARRPRQPGDDPEPITSGPAVDLLAQLGGGILGQQQLLHSFGVHMSVPGVGYLTGRQAVGAFDSWQVLSADEIKVKGRGYEVMVGENQWEQTEPDTLVCRCWRPDEQFHWKPWSPMQPTLPVLRELDGLSKKIDADIVSRLASAGIVLIPSEVEFPVRPEFANADDPFMAEIIEVISLAMRDRGSAAANVPIFIRIPGEYVDKVKHLTWATPLDAEAIHLRDEARGRFAVGMDLPAEVLTGLGSIQHWGQWFLSEEGVKYHIIPGMEAIVQGISIGFLHPGLEVLGASDPELMVWFDTSELTTRPDLSAQVTTLYDRLEVGPRALRREVGLNESDKPTQDELQEMVYRKLISDPRPELVTVGLIGLGIQVIPVTGGEGTGDVTGVEENPGPLPAPDVAPGPPLTPSDMNPAPPNAALVAAADGLVCRALEKAGNRVRQKLRPTKGGANDCPPMSIHECIGGVIACGIELPVLLAGAWERVPEIAGRLNVDSAWFGQSLELYTAGLLETGLPHTWEGLAGFLADEMRVTS